MNYAHLDYWTNSSEFSFFLIDQTAGLSGGEPEEPRYKIATTGGDETLVQGEWKSVFIPLQHFLDFDSGAYGDVVYNVGTGPRGAANDHQGILTLTQVPWGSPGSDVGPATLENPTAAAPGFALQASELDVAAPGPFMLVPTRDPSITVVWILNSPDESGESS